MVSEPNFVLSIKQLSLHSKEVSHVYTTNWNHRSLFVTLNLDSTASCSCHSSLPCPRSTNTRNLWLICWTKSTTQKCSMASHGQSLPGPHRQLHVPPSTAKGSIISLHVPPWISSVVHRLNTCATLLALSAPNLQNYEILWSSTIICTYTHHLEFLPCAVAITRHTRTEESMLMSSNVIQWCH